MKKFTRIEQEKHLKLWHNSKLTAVEYCKINGINVQAFYGWVKTDRKRKRELNPSIESKDLVKIQPLEAQQFPDSTIVLLEFDKLKIHIPEESLARVLAAIIPVLGVSNVY